MCEVFEEDVEALREWKEPLQMGCPCGPLSAAHSGLPNTNADNIAVYTYFSDLFYPAVLPDSLIRLSSFLVESVGFSMYTIMSSAHKDSMEFPQKTKNGTAF